MADIITFKDKDNTILYPQTTVNALYDADGTVLEGMSPHIFGLGGFDNLASDITYMSGKSFDKYGQLVSDLGTNYKVSDPVAVKKGDVLYQRNTVPIGSGGSMICETDAEGSFYIPLVPLDNANYEYSYVFKKDCYMAFNTRTDYSPEVYLVSRKTYSSLLDGLKEKQGNKFFVESKDVADKVIELYLTGLNAEKEYYISAMGKYASNNKYYMMIRDEDDNEVARASSDNPSGIVSISARNSSGISGYAVLSISASDPYYTDYDYFNLNLKSGTIKKNIVSDLNQSPSIKEYLSEQEFHADEAGTFLGGNAENLYSDITWNTGLYYVAHWGTEEQDKYARTNTSDTDYNYSSPFFMKAGDIIEWDGAGLNLSSAASTAAICVTDEDGLWCYPILCLYYTDRSKYRFAATRDMWVTCNIRSARNSETYFKWYRSKLVKDSVDALHELAPMFPGEKYVDLLKNCKKRETLDSATEAESIGDATTGNQVSQLVLLHFSDIHNDIQRIERILAFKNKYSWAVDDIILSGDIAGSKFSNFDTNIAELDGYSDILITVGNHDVYDHNGDAPSSHYSDRQYWATQEEKYKLWMQGKTSDESESDNIATWGVVQPTGAGENGYYPCYYYKDYTDMKVRMVVLDCMDDRDDGVQLAWFNTVLSSAKTAGLHVLVVDHYAPRISYADTQYIQCGFNCLSDTFGPNVGQAISSYVEAVDTFINSGGIFICWLCGHFHWDQIATLASHPKQMYIAIAAGNITEHMQHRAREVGQQSEDLFNIVAIDTFRKHIRVARVGSEYDRYLQHAGTMCLSYDSTGNNTPHLLTSF